jgi:hypothetical protein
MAVRITPKFAILTVAFLCVAIWLIGFDREGQPTTDEQPPAITDQPSTSLEPPESNQPSIVEPGQAEPDPLRDIRGEKKFLKKMEDEFREDYAKFKADGSLETLVSMRQDIDSFLADALVLQERAQSAYKTCIANSTDETVFNDCFEARFGIAIAMSHFGIEPTLAKLPNVSRSHLAESDAGYALNLARQVSQSRLKMQNIKNNPELAQKYGLSIPTLESLIAEAEQIQDRALSLGDDDPVRKWILLNHAELVLDDFDWRTLKYTMMVESSKPLLP